MSPSSFREPSPSDSPSLQDVNYVTGMIHYYRGEIGRTMTWRQRLDTTTTWATTITSSIITVAFSLPACPHFVFLFNLAFAWILLWIEAGRFRHYGAYQARVRMVESHFFVPMISQNRGLLVEGWRRLLCGDLIAPRHKTGMIESLAIRLRRNYSFLLIIIMLSWIGKVILHSGVANVGDFFLAFQSGPLPAWVSPLALSFSAVAVALSPFVGRKEVEERKNNGATARRWHL